MHLSRADSCDPDGRLSKIRIGLPPIEVKHQRERSLRTSSPDCRIATASALREDDTPKRSQTLAVGLTAQVVKSAHGATDHTTRNVRRHRRSVAKRSHLTLVLPALTPSCGAARLVT